MNKKFDEDDPLYSTLAFLFVLFVMIVFILALVTSIGPTPKKSEEEIEETEVELGNGVSDVIFETYSNALDTYETDRAEVREINSMNISIEKVEYSEDVKLLAQLVIAEAENQPALGQLLVADVVMNRVDHEKFPNTVKEVIFQPGQFSCVDNGRFAACADKVNDAMCEMIYNEMYQRLSYNVLYFKTNGYFDFATPACQIGDHFFSEE